MPGEKCNVITFIYYYNKGYIGQTKQHLKNH